MFTTNKHKISFRHSPKFVRNTKDGQWPYYSKQFHRHYIITPQEDKTK